MYWFEAEGVMGIIKDLYAHKIRKMEKAKDTLGLVNLFDRLHGKGYELWEQAIAALGRIADKPALEALMAQFNKLHITDDIEARKIIEAISSSGETEARKLIRSIRQNSFYQKNGCKFIPIARKALSGMGDVDALLEMIESLNYGEPEPEDVTFVCERIRQFVDNEDSLLKILANSHVQACGREALKKITDINLAGEKKLTAIVLNVAIVNDILPKIQNTHFLLELLAEMKYKGDPTEYAIIDRHYEILDDLLQEIARRGGTVSHRDGYDDCPLCHGRKSYSITEYDDNRGSNVDRIVRCPNCREKGKIRVEDVIVKHEGSEVIFRIQKNADDRIQKII